MTAAGLLAFCLCAPPDGAPPIERTITVSDEVRRSALSPYNPAPRPTPGLSAADVGGRVALTEPTDAERMAPAGHATVGGPAGAPAVSSVGLVYEPEYSIDPDLCTTPSAYVPQAGDIVLVVSDHLIWELLFAIALSREPYHVGIVVQMPDGSFGMLEAGPPEETWHVRICPLADRLPADSGRVFIRRRRVPLTAEQSDALTGFALRQDGKPYAYVRFLVHGTPLRSRGPIRTQFMGKSRGEPWSYFCSELVIEALVSTGLIDPETARPRATHPADIFYDESPNPWIDKYLKLYPCWWPPQRWVAAECGR